MKTTLSAAFVAVAATACLTIGACRKQSAGPHTATQLTADDAKIWFGTNVKGPEKIVTQTSQKTLSKTAPRRVTANRLLQLSDKVSWANAAPYQVQGEPLLIVPVQGDKMPFRNKSYEFFRSLVFYKNSAGTLDMRIVEVLSKKGEQLTGNPADISAACFGNLQSQQPQIVPGMNAFVFFFDKTYLPQGSFDLSNGQWAKTRMSFRSDLDINLDQAHSR